MIIKGTKQLGSFKRGINLYVPKKVISQPETIPSIPIDGANYLPSALMITFANKIDYTLSSHYSPTMWRQSYDFAPDFSTYYSYQIDIELGFWRIYKFDNSAYETVVQAINPSTDSNNIPLQGWTYNIGDGYPVAITAI